MARGRGDRNQTPTARAAAANANPRCQGRNRAQPIAEESVEESVAAPDAGNDAVPPPQAEWRELMQELQTLRQQAQATVHGPANAQGVLNEPFGPRQINPLLSWSMVHATLSMGVALLLWQQIGCALWNDAWRLCKCNQPRK